MKKSQGFTLIELMIVVAIIGILAAIAIPAYQDYTKRAHVSEGLTLAGGLKASISEYYASEGTWPANLAALGITAAPQGNAVSGIAVAGSLITITYNAKVTNGSTIFVRGADSGGSLTWKCTGGDVNSKYRPSNCR